jgi:hypothetical protein
MTDIATLIASLRAGTVTPADLDAAADALAGKVAVKPLEWRRAGLSPWGEYANAGLLRYRLTWTYRDAPEVWFTMRGEHDGKVIYEGRDEDAAIAAANADCSARILSALEPAPLTVADALTVPEVRALVEAAKPFYAAVFNDNGDVTISTGHITTADWLRLDAALRGIGGAE